MAPFEKLRSAPSAGLEMWGGVECTTNRLGHRYIDQLELNGHAHRPTDFTLFADLSIRTLRQLLSWERVAPGRLEDASWAWVEEQLRHLEDARIEPIVGLLHHGSGPRHTSLVDPNFPELFAAYAGEVARRYPFLRRFTPINEPLTTARFSGLYGHWYPHERSDQAFARALYHQARATVLAMEAIRQHIPDAELVQTEDLGTTSGTPELGPQIRFENARRWLTWDLLTARVDRDHELFPFLLGAGITEEQLSFFRSHRCPPSILGINHYVTSDRYLDSRVDRYPVGYRGGNGKQQYADVEAVRVQAAAPASVTQLLAEAFHRYNIPLAITEAHLGGSAEDRMRWLWGIWSAAEDARRSQIDVRAVTAWSLLGSYDWDSLVTNVRGHYEAGVFDVSSGTPQPTPAVELVRSLARHQTASHPSLEGTGWWKEASRWLYSDPDSARPTLHAARSIDRKNRPLLIAGGRGTLGRALARACEARGLPYRVTNRATMDIADVNSVRACLDETRPWAVINAAGYVRVDEAEQHRDACFRENTEGAKILAEVSQQFDAGYLTYSSDLVFDGAQSSPYTESCATSPLGVYGTSKALAEKNVLEVHPRAVVVRTSAFFGPWDHDNFVTSTARTLRAGRMVFAADDVIVSPTYVPDLSDASLDLLFRGAEGLWHLASDGALSWADLARRVAKMIGTAESQVYSCPITSLGFAARRPRYSALSSERGEPLPSLDSALRRYAESVFFMRRLAS